MSFFDVLFRSGFSFVREGNDSASDTAVIVQRMLWWNSPECNPYPEFADFFTGTITLKFSNGTTLVGNNTVTPSGHANYERQPLGTVTLSAGTYLLHVTSQQTDSWLKLRDLEMTKL